MEKRWLREFNSLGLQLRPQAAKDVTSFLRTCQAEGEDPVQRVEELVEYTKAYFRARQGVVDPIIDSHVIQAVIKCMVDAAEEHAAGEGIEGVSKSDVARQNVEQMDLGDGVQVYNVMTDVQLFQYNQASKDWLPAVRKPALFPSSEAKAKIYTERYHCLWQRLVLQGEMVPEAQARDVQLLPGQSVLTPVGSLIGNPGRKLTFGLISREHDEGIRRWCIEDLHKKYPIELEVKESENLLTDGCFVLAVGELIDGALFRISKLDMPSAVPRVVSIENDPIPRMAFGGSLTDEQVETLFKAEFQNQEGMYVVLSEVHLDNPRTVERLQDLFKGYEGSAPPIAYVFMGSFCSTAFVPTGDGVRSYREGFERLKYMMRNLPNHVQNGTRFIFVPGPNDPGAATLPKAPLADYLTADVRKEVPGVIMGSNPCRIRHFSRELVFFRHDVLRLLRRHEVVPLRSPNCTGAPSTQHVQQEMVRLLLDQAHLVPLPLEESNILWGFDHTLRLYPLPDAVFVGGVSQPFDCEYNECRFCSVGPFHRDASFYAYHPVKFLLEQCDVPDMAG
eukprot:TRINITY_DN16813_c0_g1_i1.p1 TRINITY_DN16813_c0_g1~~TRINITY_DN16813_c0_g1_i1.p1  ORF type:complete len:561 (-),score=121.19 TRINITY_DN16813_c0_g1_i1:208-1890(-)